MSGIDPVSEGSTEVISLFNALQLLLQLLGGVLENVEVRGLANVDI